MNQEQYRDILNRLKAAQSELNQAVFSDLQRLEGAESASTRVRISEAFDRGMKEAWKLSLEIGSVGYDELEEAFGTMEWEDVMNIDPKEVQTKWQEYKREKEEQEIHVGDELELPESKRRFVVSKINKDIDTVFGLNQFGNVMAVQEIKRLRKTGKKYPEMLRLLEKMKEEQVNELSDPKGKTDENK